MIKKGTRGVRMRYDTVLLPFISIVRCPGRPVIPVPDESPYQVVPIVDTGTIAATLFAATASDSEIFPAKALQTSLDLENKHFDAFPGKEPKP